MVRFLILWIVLLHEARGGRIWDSEAVEIGWDGYYVRTENWSPTFVGSPFLNGTYDKTNESGRPLRRLWGQTIAANLERSTHHCHNMRPGLSQMQYGVNSFYFRSDKDDIKRPPTQLFNFQCTTNDTNDDVYQKPNQVDRIKLIHKGTYHESMKSTSQGRQDHLEKSVWGYAGPIYKMVAEGQRDLKNVTTITTFQQEIYTATLLTAIVPLPTVQQDYDALPLPYINYQEQWSRFMHLYGTHYRTTAVFGGRLILVTKHDTTFRTHSIKNGVTSNDKNAYNTLMESVTPHFSNDASEKIADSIGGKFKIDKPLGDWVDTLEHFPDIIGSEVFPLSHVLTRKKHNPATDKKVAAFEEAMQDENMHYTIKKAIVALESVSHTNPAINVVLEELIKEAQFISPSPAVFAIAKKVVGLDLHINMSLFKVRFTRRVFWYSADWTYVVRVYDVPLFFEVCSTTLHALENIAAVDIKLPGSIKCVAGYEGEKCDGRLMALSTDYVNFLHHSSQMRSFKMC